MASATSTATLEERSSSPSNGHYGRALAASLVAHLFLVGALLFWPGFQLPPEEIELPVVMVVAGDGAAGSAGGQAGGGGAPQSAAESAAELAATEPPAAAKLMPPAPSVLPRPPRPRPQPRIAEVPPPPAPAPVPAPAAQPAIAPSPEPGTATTGVSTSGPGGITGTGQGNAGAGAGALGSGEGPGDDYFERLRRHLAKHKRYPPEATRQKQQGTVEVEFTLVRDGTVLDARIARSAGYPLLDQAVLDMLRNASPVPPLPERFSGERIRVTLPIGFSLGFFSRVF